MRTAAIVYLAWALMLLGLGGMIYHKMTDKSNPNSIQNRFEELDKVMNENP